MRTPPTTTEAVPLEIVLEALGEVLEDGDRDVGDIDAATPVERLGLASLDVAELFMALEEKTGLRLDPDSAVDVQTVGELTRLRPL